jgi:RNA polymerase sigma factor (sigma-70 family)
VPMDETEVREQLATLHSDAHGWAIRCCGGHRDEADDVLHTAYWKILGGKARFLGGASFKTWLFGVIRYSALEEYRRRSWNPLASDRFSEPQDEQTADTEPQHNDYTEHAATLAKSMRSLPKRQQQILHLVFYQDLSIENAAQVLGISTGSARTHYARGKQKLRNRLAAQLPSLA